MSAPMHIDIRGYGKIYKLVMRDRALPLLAKAIYAYFCAYAGNTTKAFPRRDKIVRDLGINKDTFTKHLNHLVEDRYIAKERTVTGNLYTIMQTVPRYEAATPEAEETNSDLLVMENIKAQGFGTVPKLVMLDQRLSAQAKAIYAYFCSFAGAGTTAFPRRTTIAQDLCMADKTYYKPFRQLTDCGYIFVEQKKNNGKFDVFLYRLADIVEQPTLPRQGEGKKSEQRATSEKVPNGEVLPRFKASAPPCNGMSEKLPSEEIPCEKTGHANITNSFQEKEQDQNHQDGGAASPAYSLVEVKQIIGYTQLMADALAWGELKDMLHHFAQPGDKDRYRIRAREIIEALAAHVCKMLNTTRHTQPLIIKLQSDIFTELVNELLQRWDMMRSVDGYVAQSLHNFFDCL